MSYLTRIGNMTFLTAAELLSEAKLSYACSANSTDEINLINLTADQQKFIGQYTNQNHKETIKDICINQSFRRDYWVKGKRILNDREKIEQFSNLNFVSTEIKDNVELNVTGHIGQADLNSKVYKPLLELFNDFKTHTGREIIKYMSETSQNTKLSQIIEACQILVGKRAIAP